MRFPKLFWNVSLVLPATALLILIAGVAGAADDDFIDADELIDPELPKYAGSDGRVDASGSDSGTWVGFNCFSLQEDMVRVKDDFRFECGTAHPDRVGLTTKQALVDQKRSNNNAHIRLVVNHLDGLPEQGRVHDLLCQKVRIKGRSNNSTEAIEAKCIIKRCDPPPTTGQPGAITEKQMASLFACIESAEEDGSLGTRVQNLKQAPSSEISGTIKSRGVWLENN
jgi:hypothetical protein